ncbi:hypothetical protein MLD52_19550 [Puniceicoccaceae bacterium K14]|nr:hypothetical protein [Puniceicoccaceae bacterium K14]
MPILSEFAVSPKSLERDQAADLRLQSRSVLSLFESSIKKYKTKDFKKVVVEVYTGDDNLEPLVSCCLNVCIVKIQEDISSFFSMGTLGKKKYIMKVLFKGLDLLVENRKIDSEILQEGYAEVRKRNFINCWEFGKKSSPNRKSVARLVCEHEIDAFTARLIVEDPSGKVLGDKEVIKERPSEYAFVNFLGKLVWKSPSEVVLLSKAKEEVGKLELKENV